jgi:predicted RNA-binding protein with PUA-like domain
MPQYWLIKSDPDTYSIDDLKREMVTPWSGVRNYQARNYLRRMRPGDALLFYHSSAGPAAIVGLATVAKAAYPEPDQFRKESKYFDETATKEKPRWFCPDVRFVEKFSQAVPIEKLRAEKTLKNLELLKRGSRLSVMPVSSQEFECIRKMAGR